MSDREQDLADLLDKTKNQLLENISEYVQRARDELKRYEEHADKKRSNLESETQDRKVWNSNGT